jgi:glycosyltransferase involved in cell wall biosynthesis
MIEAMACGTPVAAYPVTGPIDVVGNSEGGVLREDLRVASLMALKLDRRKVADYGAKFSWDAATSQFLGALRPIDRAAYIDQKELINN